MHTAQVEFLGSARSKDQFPARDLPELAFAGRSNVGKSSLINALIGHKRIARVSSTPGRTQSINFFLVNRSWVFVDLPGYGYAKVPEKIKQSWQPLIESYLADREALQGVVHILDIRREPMASDLRLEAFLAEHRIPFLLVATKADKLSKQKANRQLSVIAQGTGVPLEAILKFSAQTLLGRQALWEEIKVTMLEGQERMKTLRIEFERGKRRRAPEAAIDKDPLEES